MDIFPAPTRPSIFGRAALFVVGWFSVAFCDVVAMAAESAAGFFGAFGGSAPRYGRTEDVGIVPIIASKLEFGDVQRQVVAADPVEAAP